MSESRIVRRRRKIAVVLSCIFIAHYGLLFVMAISHALPVRVVHTVLFLTLLAFAVCALWVYVKATPMRGWTATTAKWGAVVLASLSILHGLMALYDLHFVEFDVLSTFAPELILGALMIGVVTFVGSNKHKQQG